MKFVTQQQAFGLLREFLEYETRGVFDPSDYARLAQCDRSKTATTVLDLGCGAGASIDLFRRQAPDAVWHGVDIADSPEVRKRERQDGNFATFDGVNLPYPDGHFDLVYSNQVLEHVRHPEPLLREVHRVLKPDGHFAGALSYLEPYHSFSIFNFTPFGLATVLRDANFEIDEIRAGSDAFAMIIRQLIGKPKWSRLLLRRSLYYFIVEVSGRLLGLEVAERNYLKIQFAGHLCFKAHRRG